MSTMPNTGPGRVTQWRYSCRSHRKISVMGQANHGPRRPKNSITHRSHGSKCQSTNSHESSFTLGTRLKTLHCNILHLRNVLYNTLLLGWRQCMVLCTKGITTWQKYHIISLVLWQPDEVPYHKQIGYKNYDTSSSILWIIQKFGVYTITTPFFQV